MMLCVKSSPAEAPVDEWQSQGREVPHPKSHLIPTIMSSSQAQGGHDGLVAVTTAVDNSYDNVTAVDNSYDNVRAVDHSYDNVRAVDNSYDNVRAVDNSYDNVRAVDNSYDNVTAVATTLKSEKLGVTLSLSLQQG
ncbi:hypothetical protein C0Q70_15863 [Pomacea canaliculata]|uniref:Uncharacterized protein n=1 Tax=Pomacea canaliculata TaxID=400727 RepID=A0A2T7NW11_POMCA|nr:hypothetical protein C0Q70_15863 [Pomacea canaliculata]